MKTYFNSSIKIIAFLLIASAILFGCENDDADPNFVEFENIQVTGSQQVPSNASTASGVFRGTYNKTTKSLRYTLTFTGLTPTDMHFHKGAIGVNGDVVLLVSNPPYTSPITNFTQSLTDEQEADLLGGLWYINIHSAAFPQGEIRGQIE